MVAIEGCAAGGFCAVEGDSFAIKVSIYVVKDEFLS